MHTFGHNLAEAMERARRMGVEKEYPEVIAARTYRGASHTNEENPLAMCRCGRVTQADMLVRHDGRYKCDACWTAERRMGEL